MIDFSQAMIARLAVHRVGNKSQDEDVIISQKLADVTPELEGALMQYFIKPFKADAFYKFTHPTGVEMNEVYTYAKSIFLDQGATYIQSVNVLKHLYHQSVHPNIKGGELYVVLLKNCELDGEAMDAVGIFKSENKDVFLHFRQENDGLEIDPLEGINIKKLDKGAIIFNTEAEDGFRVMTIDASGKDTVYWMDDFLQVVEDSDENFFTRDALSLCNNFAKDVLAAEHGKRDEVLFMKQAVEYFSKTERFNTEVFADDIIQEPGYVQAFNDYVETFETRIGRKVENDFFISEPALKSMKKKFKDTIKLDTNIHIKLNFDNLESGGRFIEKGFDPEMKMSFYKVYFNEELD